jgi:GxxExxY protein
MAIVGYCYLSTNPTYMNPTPLNEISYQIIGAAYRVHSALGPGLLESTYEVCLEYELLKANLRVARQKALPVVYEEVKLDAGYRIDLLVENAVILEVKSTDGLSPIHQAQIMTYLKLSKVKLGLLLNFNVRNMQDGIKRVIL